MDLPWTVQIWLNSNMHGDVFFFRIEAEQGNSITSVESRAAVIKICTSSMESSLEPGALISGVETATEKWGGGA